MKKILLTSLKIIGSILALVVLYLFLGYFLPYIPVQAEASPEPKVVKAYIMTNGVHTDIVMPIKSDFVDWSQKFPFQYTRSKQSDYQYLAIGWGDKGFYLDTPTWSDLKFSTAFNAAFWLGDSAVHTTYYKSIKIDETVKPFVMTERQYKNLIKYIEKSLDKDQSGNAIYINTNAQYRNSDAFYEAKGSYSFLYTCNTWTNNALKVAGQKAALWTPTDTGIFQHYE